ncbi:hypothetical protein O0L34_g4754 [Tuta absoluta]|nr:hypothetical protein O0L34_g4754 [Tuta absoluta]
MRAFFNDQKNKVERALYNANEEAKKVKDTVNNYFEDQQKKFSSDISSYVESVKESGRKMGDTYSYLPDEDDSASRLENPDETLSVPAMIARHGYRCETHTVVSKGYILNVHRIPSGKNSEVFDGVPKKTVFLQHGLFASSADWILNGPEKGLAYVLADAGYDVWMGNIRGNKYSREHAWLKLKSKAYWNFSWHDVAEHDVPAVVDYILKIKGAGTKITYIGHSMGTTILFAMLSIRPEYNNILTAGFALAPVVFLSDVRSPAKALAPIASNVASMEMVYGVYEFIPKNSPLGKMTSSCQVDKVDFVLCKSALFYICGYDEKQFNKNLLPVFLSHLGTGTSWKTAIHFAQEVNSGGNFQKFDYGSFHNKRIYGTETPPAYDLSKVTLPISLFWAKNDLLSGEADIKKLLSKLPPSTESYEVPFPDFNHLDYLWAVDANSLLNNKILDSLSRVNRENSVFQFDIKFMK